MSQSRLPENARASEEKMTRQECGAAGILVRLATTTNWADMTAAANDSKLHVAGMERWRQKAREENPALSDDQVERLAALLRKEHFRRMARLSAQARRLAREAEAELGPEAA